MATIDRTDIREFTGEGSLADYVFDTAEPFLRAVENGLKLKTKEELNEEKVKEALRVLGNFSGYLYQTAKNVSESRVFAVHNGIEGMSLESVCLAELYLSESLQTPIDSALKSLLFGKMDDQLIDMISMSTYDILLEYFSAAHAENEEKVKRFSPLIALLPQTLVTPFGNRQLATLLVAG